MVILGLILVGAAAMVWPPLGTAILIAWWVVYAVTR